MEFRFLRKSSEQSLEVREGLLGEEEWPGKPPLLDWSGNGGSHLRVFDAANGYVIWREDLGWFTVEPDRFRIQIPPTEDPVLRETSLWGLPIALCHTHQGHLALHAAAVDVRGGALLFAGPSHYGKTTLAGAFLAAGHRLLAEDMTYCRLSPELSALPGPALLRMRRDIHGRLNLPGTEIAAGDSEKVYLAIDEELRGDGSPVPVRAVIFLRRSAGEVRLEPVSATGSLQDLWSMTFRLPTDEDRRRCFGAISAVAAAVPMWNLYRPLDLDALDTIIGETTRICAS